MSPLWKHFGEMCWPQPGEEMDQLNRTLRYGTADDVMSVRMSAASVVSAYSALVMATQKKRAMVVRNLRQEQEQATEVREG